MNKRWESELDDSGYLKVNARPTRNIDNLTGKITTRPNWDNFITVDPTTINDNDAYEWERIKRLLLKGLR